MYEVVTVITPINYFIRYPKALNSINATNHTSLNELDVCVLGALDEAKKGMRRQAIQGAIQMRFYEPKFIRSIATLLDKRYITRSQLGRAVLYSITLAGRQELHDLNDKLIELASK
jgi:hypothetical protein